MKFIKRKFKLTSITMMTRYYLHIFVANRRRRSNLGEPSPVDASHPTAAENPNEQHLVPQL